MADFDNFLVASPRYFETMSRYPAKAEYASLLSTLLPPDWTLTRQDVWFVASARDLTSAAQGFKIHVSSTEMDAVAVLKCVVPICVQSRTIFKFAADSRILGMLTTKRCARQSSGKFMTIYPRDHEHFVALIEDIHAATTGFAGPYILSDQRYRDSKVVFYRYGGFVSRRRLLISGLCKHVITGLGGLEIDDERTPFFSLPAGVTDPFTADRDESDATVLPTLTGRFQVTRALAFSNAGGVYVARDIYSNDEVVVKEARPHTILWSADSVSIDAVELLTREYEMLETLRPLSVFPRPIDLFQEWEHWFLVQELVSGQPLRTYRARDDVALLAHLYEADRVALFARVFRAISQQLIAIIERVHARGVVLGDVSPSNVLVDPETLKVRLIDVEGACRRDEGGAFASFARAWYTPGFRDPEQPATGASPAPEDDWYALGMLLQGLFLPLEGMVRLSPDALPMFLTRFIDAGLPRFIEVCITSLLAGDVEGARLAVAA
jgi:hypothetical protein